MPSKPDRCAVPEGVQQCLVPVWQSRGSCRTTVEKASRPIVRRILDCIWMPFPQVSARRVPIQAAELQLAAFWQGFTGCGWVGDRGKLVVLFPVGLGEQRWQARRI